MFKMLDLYGGTQSNKKGLDLLDIEYKYYAIDIYSPEGENIILDLSQDDIVEKLVEVLPKGFKPDLLWMGIPCNKFSLATAVKGGNLYFQKDGKNIKIREDFEVLKNTVYKNKNTETIQEEAALAIKLVNNAIEIANYYDCDFIIENPWSSYIVHFLDPMLIRNKVDYCMYGYDYQKPTCIYSNYVLNLKTCNHTELHTAKIGSKTTKKDIKQNKNFSYQQKASVPPLLIQEILKHFIQGGK